MNGEPDTVLDSMLRHSKKHGGRLVGRESRIAKLTFGSRFAFRMLGMLTPGRWVPVTVNVAVTGDAVNDTRVTVEMLSNEGRYLINVKSLSSRLFQRGFNRVSTILRQAAPSPD